MNVMILRHCRIFIILYHEISKRDAASENVVVLELAPWRTVNEPDSCPYQQLTVSPQEARGTYINLVVCHKVQHCDFDMAIFEIRSIH